MPARQCYHCKQWIEEGEAHDCWTTTEGALTQDLPDDLREAWERLRETAAEFGDQRIYASHHCIMFSRKSCYFFVRPKKNYLELCVFLGRALKDPRVRRVEEASKVKRVNVIRITHRDEVEPPITDWLREAYELQETRVERQSETSGKTETSGKAEKRKKGSKKKTRKNLKKKPPNKKKGLTKT